MSDTVLIRQHLESSLPPGDFWESKGDFSLLLDGMSEILTDFYANAKQTACIRDVFDTNLILDLADEYGFDIFSTLTDSEIRNLVNAYKVGVKEPGVGDFELALQRAGFDVQVHRNGPTPASPFTFLGTGIPFAVDGNETSVDGNENAIDGTFPGGYILVNGNIFATIPLYSSVDGNENMVDGNELAVDGYFTEVENLEYSIILPVNSDRWNNIYFICGDVTRDGITGEIVAIAETDVPLSRQLEFETLVLKYGPGEGWAGMIINYV